MDINEAVAILNERKWLGLENWQVCDDSVLSLGYRDYLGEEAIAIATGLVNADALKAAQEQNERQYQTMMKANNLSVEYQNELEQLRAERDNMREALLLAKRYGNFDPLSDQTIIRAINAALAAAGKEKGE